MKDRHDYHFEILWDEKRDFSEWNVDHKKLEQMIGRIEKDKDGDLVVEFLEHKTSDEFGQINKLSESAITIHSTENGTDINKK